ncbi:MAG: DUF4139 domain-containing protein [Phycisphaeraceae bacterium]
MKRLLSLLLIAALPVTAAAENNIDLSTIQPREGVQLTIYNAEDLTLVRETRTVTFREGDNPLQFSWANTLIDPTSVELRFLDHQDSLSLVDTTFPHDKPQQLEWHVASETTGRATVEISYFTSGVTWSADYVGIVSPDEDRLELRGFVSVQNNSGEDFEDAEVRLVVGTINLVEKIAQLARQPFKQDMPAEELERRVGTVRYDELAKESAVQFMGARRARAEADSAQAPEVVKEGLSEYFIFTIEGEHDVPHNFRQRLRSFEPADAELVTEYRYRPNQYGNQLVRMLLIENTEDNDLGDSPLPDGVVRVFKQTEQAGLTYVGQQSTPYVPIGEEVELNMGPDPSVRFELEPLRAYREGIWATFNNNVRRRLDEPGVRIRDAGRVVGWNEHTVADRIIRNFTDRAITVAVRRPVPGDARFITDQVEAGTYDAHTVEYTAEVAAGETRRIRHEVMTRQGENAEQNRVQVVQQPAADVPWRD